MCLNTAESEMPSSYWKAAVNTIFGHFFLFLFGVVVVIVLEEKVLSLYTFYHLEIQEKNHEVTEIKDYHVYCILGLLKHRNVLY